MASPMTGIGRVIRQLPAGRGDLRALSCLAARGVVPRLARIPAAEPASGAAAMVGDEIPWGRTSVVTAVEIVGAFVLAGARRRGARRGDRLVADAMSRALTPFLVFVNTLPKVAIAPLFLMWMGYGILPNMLIGALIGFFPVVINTAVGLTQIDQDLRRPRPRLQRAEVEGVPEDPRAERVPLHPERAEGHGDGRGGRRHRRRVRRLAARPRLRDHHDAEQHEHAGRLRGAGLDLGARPRAVRLRRRAVAVARAVGRRRVQRGPWIEVSTVRGVLA